ncbi:MAG: response regulator [Desulfotignum sp.]|nr:response regulator [Desulfotignum sp.]
MKLKYIFFCFTILTLLSSAFGLYFYYNAQKIAAYNEDRLTSISHTDSIKHSFSEMISRYQRITLSLSRCPAISLLLKQHSLENLKNANNILDIYNASMKTSACYLMDMNGITIASSNRNDLSSFVGKDYSFRSYFKNAVQGTQSVYMAQGITSGKRGIYYSCPVFDEEKTLTGVVVIKENVEVIEDDILGRHAPTHADHKDWVFITDENGVVFISDHTDKILHTLWEIDKKSIARLNSSKQFGKGPWPWIGFRQTGQGKVSDKSGKKYDLIRTDIKELSGWEIVHLSNTEAISGRVLSSLFNAAGYIILFLFVLLVSVLFILNFQATKTGNTVQKRIEYEKVLGTLSSNLAGIGIDSIDTAIDNSLSLIGNFTQADRTYIFQFNKNPHTMVNTHEWCAIGVEPQIHNLKDIPVEEKLPWFMEHIRNNEIFNVPDVSKLPEKAQSEKKHFGDQGIQSLMVLPIEKSGNLLGFLGFDSVSKCREWENNEESLLRFFGQGLGHVLDREKAEKKLKFLEKRNQALLDHSPVCHKIVDLDFNLQYMSANGYKMLKLDDNAKVYGQPYPFKFFPEPFRKEMAENLKKVKDTGKMRMIEALANDIEGNEVWLESTLIPVFDDHETVEYLTVVSADTTWRKEDERARHRLESQLHQSQKMEAIGNLAGGIAHDFNNILSSIIGFTQLALDQVEENTEFEDDLQEVLTAGNRAKDLVKQILAFARQSEEETRPLQPSVIIKEVLRFIRSSIPTSIEIRQNIKSDSFIRGNPTQIHQILMNFCTNAAHAMEDHGGLLEVNIKDISIEPGTKKDTIDVKPGDYIQLSVSDTGTGIPDEIITSIFDPYFTTKKFGEGTGMGLAVVQGIVEIYGGKITVDSRLGQGSTFTAYLPITKKEKLDRIYTHEELPTGSEKILYVDDEASIAKMGKRTLEQLGYSVEIKTESLKALEFFRSNPTDIDLVITDMTMPHMTGEVLSSELMNIRPDIPVILCTGFSKKVSDESATEIGIKAFVRKPFVKADLAKTVRKVLDETKR